MPDKANLIDAIRTHNPTAPVNWLAGFSPEALRMYLDHLLSTLEPKPSAWVRPGDTPAMMTRSTAA